MDLTRIIEELLKDLEQIRSKCQCPEADNALAKVRALAIGVGVLADYVTYTYSEARRILNQYYSTPGDEYDNLVDSLMKSDVEYFDELAKRVNMPQDRLVEILEILRKMGVIDYELKYDGGLKIALRRLR